MDRFAGELYCVAYKKGRPASHYGFWVCLFFKPKSILLTEHPDGPAAVQGNC